MVKLRPYQEEAFRSVMQTWDQGVQRTLLVLPTGTGKTIVFAKIAEQLVRNGERVLILAHRGELLDQAADKIKTATGIESALEKAKDSAAGSILPITVGSVQTLQSEKRLERFSPKHYTTIIIDEAHHSLSASYRNVINYFSGAKLLGVTATPDRGDKKDLGQVFESIAYEYDMRSAIRDGYLCPIRAQTIPLNLDISKVGISAGDFKAGEIGDALEPYLHQIAMEMRKYCSDRKTVVFLPLVKTSQRFCELLNRYGFKAAEVNGTSANREQVLKDFDAGRYNVLCNSMLLTEGWDCPSVDCVIVLRPTKVRSLYSQMIGRGTRLYPGKDHLLVLDFLWHTARHELCHPASLVTQNPEVSDRMTEILADPELQQVLDLLDLEETASKDVIKQREEALARELREKRMRQAKLVDPLQFEMSIQDTDLMYYEPTMLWEMGPVTEKQAAFLDKRGINPQSVNCCGKAKMIIDRLIKRQDAGLSTPKQIRLLERKGFLHVGEWSFDAASKMISRLSMNRWQVPRGVDPETYRPAALNIPEMDPEFDWRTV